MATMTHQRKGVSSNAQAGKDFENQIIQFFNENGFSLEKQKKLKLGIKVLKEHAFDFGNDNILIECKTHKWTETDGVPHGKLHGRVEAMYLFYITPLKYKKIFIVDMDYNQKRCKTLLDYFIEHYAYLIPEDVILVDYNTETDDFEAYKFDSKSNMFIHFFADDFWKYLKEK